MTSTSYIVMAFAALYFIGVFMIMSSISPVMNRQGIDSIMDLPSRYTKTPSHRLPTLEELTGNPDYISCPSPLVPIYDRIVDGFQERKIPRAIHVSMKSRCLPPDLAATPNAWKEALPHHSFYFHDDDAVDRLFDFEWKEFPQLKQMMRCVLYKGAMKIDVWRVLILFVYGGIYTDIDNEPLPAFTELSPISAKDEFFTFSDAWERPSQWFFAMEPNHPIGYYTMFEIFKRLQDLKDVKRPKVVFVTGPDVLKHGYGNALGWPEKLFDEGVHKCKKFNKTATKLSKTSTRTYIRTIEFDKVVLDNGENITVRERIERQSGVLHWTKQVAKNILDVEESCLDLLYISGNVESTFDH